MADSSENGLPAIISLTCAALGIPIAAATGDASLMKQIKKRNADGILKRLHRLATNYGAGDDDIFTVPRRQLQMKLALEDTQW